MMIVKKRVHQTIIKKEGEKHTLKLNKNDEMPLKKVMIAFKI